MITTDCAYFFKGKRKDNGEWVAGNHQHKKVPTKLVPTSDDYEKVSFISDDLLGSLCFEVIPETVGMWNGLEDDHGAYFFVGDIVECWDESAEDPNWGLDRIHRGVLVLSKGAFSLKVYQKGKAYVYVDHWLKAENKVVIGNIHDNPELLQ